MFQDTYGGDQIIFVMGLPAAGKSTWIANNLPGYGWIDPDKIKELHPAYDPYKPHLVHGWSKAMASGLFDAILKRQFGHWVIEGTGANANEMVYNLQIAHEAGFITTLVYVKCSLTKVLLRNTCRPRIIPADIILEKASTIDNSFMLAALYADNVMEVDNNADYKEPLHLILKFKG
jgi:predicted kinase